MSEAAEILAELRAAAPELEVFLPESCEVLSSGALDNDAWGGVVEGPVVETTYPCRLKPLTGREAQDAARVASDAQYRLTLPLDAVVEEPSTVRYRGREYPVLAVWRSTYALETKVLLGAGVAS